MLRFVPIILTLLFVTDDAFGQYLVRSPSRRVVQSRRPARAPYRLDRGDILAVIVDGVLGSFKDAPVHMPGDGKDILPCMGHPVPVLDNGSVFLPLVRTISVRGLTVIEANRRIQEAYLNGGFLKEKSDVIVSLMRKRTVRVTVLHSRRDAKGNAASTVNVQAHGATVLSAIAKAGAYDRDATVELLRGRGQGYGSLMTPIQNGDTLNMRSPQNGFYYTGGLLPAGEHQIPSGRRLTMLQAMSRVGGSVGGRFGPSQLMVIPQNGRPYYLDAIRGGRANRISPGDTLVLQYRPHEAVTQFATYNLLPILALGF